MSPEKFEELDFDQKRTMLMAIHVRNALENFHSKHIPDGLMPELNSTIRYAIHDFFTSVSSDERALAWLVTIAPNYWEVPGADPKPTFTDEDLWQGKPIPKG